MSRCLNDVIAILLYSIYFKFTYIIICVHIVQLEHQKKTSLLYIHVYTNLSV